jgi:hypothetical protein
VVPRPLMHTDCLISYLQELPTLPADHPHRQHGVTAWRGAVVRLMHCPDLASHWPEVCQVVQSYLLGENEVYQQLPQVCFDADPQAWLDVGLMAGLNALASEWHDCLRPNSSSSCALPMPTASPAPV